MNAHVDLKTFRLWVKLQKVLARKTEKVASLNFLGFGLTTPECDYKFQKDADSEPRQVHNVIESRFCFEGGLIREQHDNCDFWNWFGQAISFGQAVHAFDFLEDKMEQLLQRELPLNIEKKVRDKVKETAREKLDDFIKQNPQYAD